MPEFRASHGFPGNADTGFVGDDDADAGDRVLVNRFGKMHIRQGTARTDGPHVGISSGGTGSASSQYSPSELHYAPIFRGTPMKKPTPAVAATKEGSTLAAGSRFVFDTY